jgi:hypothetical protein
MSSLPKELNDLVNQYEDEFKYTDAIINSNPIVKKDILYDELKDIDLKEIIKFKLARQLSIQYTNKSKAFKKNNREISIITGVFLELLNVYSYDELLDSKKLKINIDFDAVKPNEIKNISEYIQYLFSLEKELNKPNFDDWKKEILPKFSKESQKKIKKIITNEKWDDIEIMDFFRGAWDSIIFGDPKHIDLTSKKWTDRLPEFEKELLDYFEDEENKNENN